jgi:putative phage-type endonuclease
MIRDSEWHARRAKGIGGSDAGAVLGISPFKSPLRLWMEKRGEIQPDDIDAQENVYWGQRLEHLIAEEFANRSGLEIRQTGELSQHPHYEWMICNVDAFVINVPQRVITEIKNVDRFAFHAGKWGPDGSAQVPDYYYAQAQHNMEVTGAVLCYMPILVGGNDYRCYVIPRDERFVKFLIAHEAEFWRKVQHGIKPAPVDNEDLKILFPNHAPGIHLDATDETALAWARLCAIKPKLGALVKEKKECEFAIKKEMGVAEHLSYNGAKLATWRTGESGRRTFRIVTGGVDDAAEEMAGDE